MAFSQIYNEGFWGQLLPQACFGFKNESNTHVSIYNKDGFPSNLYPAALRAILNYLFVKHGENSGGIGIYSSESLIAEYQDNNNVTQLVSFNPKNGIFCARQVSITGGIEPYILAPGRQSGEAIFYTLMPIAMQDDEFNSHLDIFEKYMYTKDISVEIANASALVLCDNFYHRIKNGDNCNNSIILNIPQDGKLSDFSQTDLDAGYYIPHSIIVGSFNLLRSNNIDSYETRISNITVHDFKSKYVFFDEKRLSKREQKLIPYVSENYDIPIEAEIICSHIKNTTEANIPFRNFILYGPSGTGKSKTAEIVAYGLGLPFLRFTCEPDMERDGFLKTVIINDKPHGDVIIPTLDDVIINPVATYESITGELKENASSSDAYYALMEKIKGNENKYKYIESELLTALKKGYVVEVQELSYPRSSVAAALNPLFDDAQSITLPTGEKIKRHKDSVVIFTTNVDYSGCQEINNALYSRLSLKLFVDDLSVSEMAKRAYKRTGFDNMAALMKMATITKNIKSFCTENNITDGVCGFREYLYFISSYMVTNDFKLSALITVIPSASKHEDNRRLIIQHLELDNLLQSAGGIAA